MWSPDDTNCGIGNLLKLVRIGHCSCSPLSHYTKNVIILLEDLMNRPYLTILHTYHSKK